MADAFLICLYGLISFFIGYFLPRNKTASLTAFLLNYAILFAVLIFFLGVFFLSDPGLQQAAYTFSSVYFGFWLGFERKKLQEKSLLKFSLGLIWNELQFNRHQYEVLEKNFKFLFDSPERIKLNAFKMSTIFTLLGQLKESAHTNYISSGAVTALPSLPLPVKEKDDLYNTIEIAYNNIEQLKAFLLTVLTDFNNKAVIADEIIGGPFAELVSKDMESKVKKSALELMIAKRTCLIAIDKVDQFLNKLKVKAEFEEIREEVLTAEDKTFINGVIRREPVDPSEVFNQQQ